VKINPVLAKPRTVGFVPLDEAQDASNLDLEKNSAEEWVLIAIIQVSQAKGRL